MNHRSFIRRAIRSHAHWAHPDNYRVDVQPTMRAGDQLHYNNKWQIVRHPQPQPSLTEAGELTVWP